MLSLHTSQFSNPASFVFRYSARYLSLFFPVMLQIRPLNGSVEKRHKWCLERPYDYLVSTKAHFYYSLIVQIKDAWEQNNRCVAEVGNSYMDGPRKNCVGRPYLKCLLLADFPSPWPPTASHLLLCSSPPPRKAFWKQDELFLFHSLWSYNFSMLFTNFQAHILFENCSFFSWIFFSPNPLIF